MDITEFSRLLRIGQGRAVLYLRDHDAVPYRDAILEACLHNQAFYTQFEGSRAPYMLDVIAATREPEYYMRKIIDGLLALTDDADDYDIEQLYNFAERLARTGNEQARAAMYQKAAENLALANFTGPSWIVELDGERGFAFIAERIGQKLLSGGVEVFHTANREFEVDEQIIWGLLKDEERKQPHLAPLMAQYADNAGIMAYLNVLQTDYGERDADPRPPSASPLDTDWPYPDVKALLMNKRSISVKRIRIWGASAAEPDFLQAAADLLTQTEPYPLRNFLHIFGKRPFPLDVALVLPYVNHPDELVNYPATLVLEMVKHPLVRDLALRWIAARTRLENAVGLLKANYQDGDWALIEPLTVLSDTTDCVGYHSMAYDVRALYELHPDPVELQALRNLYEYGPCSMCREYTLNLLFKAGAVTDAMRAECAWDSDEDIRRMMDADSAT